LALLAQVQLMLQRCLLLLLLLQRPWRRKLLHDHAR
jgi:hypothetical protein